MEATRICTVPSCEKRHEAKGLCQKHYDYMRRTGKPYKACETCSVPLSVATNKYCSEACKPRCDVDGCDSPVRKRLWCSSHYSQWHREGVVRPFTYKWSDEYRCTVCGKDVEPGSGFRKYCSISCTALSDRPKVFNCGRCGTTVSLIEKSTKAGQFKRADSKLCDRCARRPRRYKITVDHLAARDGTDCALCGEAVDMSAGPTDPARPSVDHKWPRSRGGTDDPENLQLAHLDCNQRKSDKIA